MQCGGEFDGQREGTCVSVIALGLGRTFSDGQQSGAQDACEVKERLGKSARAGISQALDIRFRNHSETHK